MDLDVTLLIQMALLLLLISIFGRWLFVPVLHVIEQRQQRIHGLAREVQQLDKMSQADRAAHAQKVLAGRRQALVDREGLRARGRNEARRLVAEARASLAAGQALARAQVKAEEQLIAKQLQEAVGSLTDSLIAKLAGDKKAS
jgi:F0F1-type ATP synthase membrane subunit b/b'